MIIIFRYYILFFLINLIINQVHFNDLPDSTGIFQAVIINNIIGLDVGDEVGLFDANGLLSDDCSDEYGEILVGSGVYNADTLLISGFGSIDFCDFTDGYQLPGYMNNNSISIKVWDASENIEYIPEVNYTIGSGDWGDIFSVIDVLIVHELGSAIDDFSLYHLYPNPFNSSIIFDINSSNYSIINISIFNLKGERIDNLLFNPINQDKIIWDASNFNSGIYFVKFHNSKFSISKKITLIK